MLGVNTLIGFLSLSANCTASLIIISISLDKRPLSMVMMIFSFACRFVLGTYIQNSTGIKHDGDLTLGLATRCWRDSSQLELAQQVFILRHGSFTFET